MWRDNTGFCPSQLLDKPDTRVFVRLRNGSEPKESWPADPKRGTKWCFRYRERYPFDIVAWRPAQ